MKKYDSFMSISNKRNIHNLNLPVLSASQEKGMILRSENGIDIKYDQNKINTYKIVNSGDYVVHLRSFQGGFAFSTIDGICSPAYTILKCNPEMIEYGFFEQYFTSKKFIDNLRIVTYGIRDGRSISVEEFLNLKGTFPNKNEQLKIIKFYTLINKRIDTQSKIIEKYESLIKAISNKLFFNITNRVNLSEICSITTGKLDVNQMDENGIYPFFTCGKETLKINKYAFDCEAILISGNGDIGRTKYYNGKFNAYQRTYILYNFKGSPIFVKYAIDYALPKKVKEETQISAMPYIKLGTLSELSIPYPDIHIQIEDVQILNTLQTKINVETEILEKLKEQKKYLLSNMFI